MWVAMPVWGDQDPPLPVVKLRVLDSAALGMGLNAAATALLLPAWRGLPGNDDNRGGWVRATCFREGAGRHHALGVQSPWAATSVTSCQKR